MRVKGCKDRPGEEKRGGKKGKKRWQIKMKEISLMVEAKREIKKRS